MNSSCADILLFSAYKVCSLIFRVNTWPSLTYTPEVEHFSAIPCHRRELAFFSYFTQPLKMIAGERCTWWDDKQQVLDWCSAPMGWFRYSRHRTIHSRQIPGLCMIFTWLCLVDCLPSARSPIPWAYTLPRLVSWSEWTWHTTCGRLMAIGSLAWNL